MRRFTGCGVGVVSTLIPSANSIIPLPPPLELMAALGVSDMSFEKVRRGKCTASAGAERDDEACDCDGRCGRELEALDAESAPMDRDADERCECVRDDCGNCRGGRTADSPMTRGWCCRSILDVLSPTNNIPSRSCCSRARCRLKSLIVVLG